MWWKIGIDVLMSVLSFVFPALKPPSPEAEAQKQKDRADGAESLLKARIEGDAIENNVAAAVAADPSKLREHDRFELK